MKSSGTVASLCATVAGVALLAVAMPAIADRPRLPNLPSSPTVNTSTVPPTGDANPYGVAFVPDGFPADGPLRAGDVLVSNFNNGANQQGTGASIVQVSPPGNASVFFQGSTPLGLTTALGVLRRGFVLVGTLPTTYDSIGNVMSIGQGSLLVLNRFGTVVATLSDPALLDGPWDLTVRDLGDKAQVFVSN